MNHQDALREMSVERYMLGELTGESRDVFEEHLFDCQQCAQDLKSGVMLLEGARVELAAPIPAKAPVPQGRAQKFQWLFSPAWMVPALAACLLLLVYQSFVVVPGARRQIAQAEAPAILNNLVLAGGAARGGNLPRVVAPAHGSFLLSVDIPALTGYSAYRCSLYSPAGALVWHGDVSPEQARDTVQIHVPAAVTQPGQNTLLVQGLRQNDPAGAKLDDLATHKFLLDFQK